MRISATNQAGNELSFSRIHLLREWPSQRAQPSAATGLAIELSQGIAAVPGFALDFRAGKSLRGRDRCRAQLDVSLAGRSQCHVHRLLDEVAVIARCRLDQLQPSDEARVV